MPGKLGRRTEAVTGGREGMQGTETRIGETSESG
jgi:hypothetical protein